MSRSEIESEDAHDSPNSKWLRSITRNWGYLEFSKIRKFGSNYIGIVPKEYREGNEDQYTPRTVSIGPLHANSSRLLGGQEMKLQFIRSFISRLPEGKDLRSLLDLMETKLEAVSSYYGHDAFGQHDIAQMMVVDGCFIIEILSIWGQEAGHPFFRKNGEIDSLHRDILLLENQLPYFVLELLQDQTCTTHTSSLDTLVMGFCDRLLPLHFNEFDDLSGRRPNHLLELAWGCITTKREPRNISVSGYYRGFQVGLINNAKSATELVPYGVVYESYFLNASLAQVSFESKLGKLSLPYMIYGEETKSLLWNLLAFEQLAEPNSASGYPFQSFLLFMNTLIKTEEDVRILARHGAIRPLVRELSEIVSLFDSLASKVNLEKIDNTNFFLANVLVEMNRYCLTGYRPMRAYMVRLFTGARWDPVSAVLLFILTVTQTFFAIASYGRGK